MVYNWLWLHPIKHRSPGPGMVSDPCVPSLFATFSTASCACCSSLPVPWPWHCAVQNYWVKQSWASFERSSFSKHISVWFSSCRCGEGIQVGGPRLAFTATNSITSSLYKNIYTIIYIYIYIYIYKYIHMYTIWNYHMCMEASLSSSIFRVKCPCGLGCLRSSLNLGGLLAVGTVP